MDDAAVDARGGKAERQQAAVQLDCSRVADALVAVADEEIDVSRLRDQLEVRRGLERRVDLPGEHRDHEARVEERRRLHRESPTAGVAEQHERHVWTPEIPERA